MTVALILVAQAGMSDMISIVPQSRNENELPRISERLRSDTGYYRVLAIGDNNLMDYVSWMTDVRFANGFAMLQSRVPEYAPPDVHAQRCRCPTSSLGQYSPFGRLGCSILDQPVPSIC